jgi:hypothetical protein
MNKYSNHRICCLKSLLFRRLPCHRHTAERILPRKFRTYFINETGEIISDIIEYKADSIADNRMTKIRFTLKDRIYKENEKCYLILDQDEKALEKYKKIPYEISLLITDDFGF